MKIADYEARIANLIAQGAELLENPMRGEFTVYVDLEGFTYFYTSSLSLLAHLFGQDSPSYRTFADLENSNEIHIVQQGLGILRAVEEEIRGGWLITVKGLLSAEVFSDFLEMAEYLLGEGYKDAAAVIIGSTLEGHLRQLCQKNDIPIAVTNRAGKEIPKKAASLNDDLAKTGVYNRLDHKNVTAYLDLRNKAAHGQYDSYTESQVQLMHRSVFDFITRVPV